jgi:FeS assembly SUF system regulator
MLRMSKMTDYATVVMTYLAREPARWHTANEVADHVHVAPPTVRKILKRLARVGLVSSHRGTKGGYLLARSADKINMAQVIDALEGPIGLTECSIMPGQCEQETSCSVRGNWQKINGAVRGALEQISLAEMVRPVSSQMVRFEKSKRRSVNEWAGR